MDPDPDHIAKLVRRALAEVRIVPVRLVLSAPRFVDSDSELGSNLTRVNSYTRAEWWTPLHYRHIA